MLSLLISLLVLLLILGLCWWILSLIPIPSQFKWIVQVIFAIICLVCVFSLLTGTWTFPLGHVVVR